MKVDWARPMKTLHKNSCLSALLAAIVGVSAPTDAFGGDTPIAPWDNPKTPQTYHPQQIYSKSCKSEDVREKILAKYKHGTLSNGPMDNGRITISPEYLYKKRIIGSEHDRRSIQFVRKYRYNNEIAYEYIVKNLSVGHSYFSITPLNATVISIFIDNKRYNFPAVATSQSLVTCRLAAKNSPFLNDCFGTAEVRFKVDEEVFKKIASMDHIQRIKATYWRKDGFSGSCPMYILPREFKLVENSIFAE